MWVQTGHSTCTCTVRCMWLNFEHTKISNRSKKNEFRDDEKRIRICEIIQEKKNPKSFEITSGQMARAYRKCFSVGFRLTKLHFARMCPCPNFRIKANRRQKRACKGANKRSFCPKRSSHFLLHEWQKPWKTCIPRQQC